MGFVPCVEEIRNVYNISVMEPEGKEHLTNLDREGK
jgi:hypothetical protein